MKLVCWDVGWSEHSLLRTWWADLEWQIDDFNGTAWECEDIHVLILYIIIMLIADSVLDIIAGYVSDENDINQN